MRGHDVLFNYVCCDNYFANRLADHLNFDIAQDSFVRGGNAFKERYIFQNSDVREMYTNRRWPE